MIKNIVIVIATFVCVFGFLYYMGNYSQISPKIQLPFHPQESVAQINYESMLTIPHATPAHPNWTPGPLNKIKVNISKQLEPSLQTGDILFRSSNAQAANGLQFSKYVEKATNSDFSHASIVLKANNKVYVLEIDDEGVQLYKFMDWLDTPAAADFAVYRLRNFKQNTLKNIKQEIDNILHTNPSYDFTFDDPDKLYCVECVAEIYLHCGIKLCNPKTIKEILSPVQYAFFAPVNRHMRQNLGQGIPEDTPLWFVGNEEQGLMSSTYLFEFYRYS